MKEEKKPGLIKSLDELLPVPPRDPQSAVRGKAKFLQQVSELRSLGIQTPVKSHHFFLGTIFHPSRGGRNRLVIKPLATALLILVFLIATSAVTVVASQGSLPGESLYPLKTWSEDTRLALAEAPLARLGRLLDFSDRRVDEMASLVISARPIPKDTLIRFLDELDDVLELAASMDDSQLIQQNERIRIRTELQLDKLEAIIQAAEPSEQLILQRTRARLEEQLYLCEFASEDPQGFRLLIAQRMQGSRRQGEGGNDNGNGTQVGTPSETNGGGFGPGSGQKTPANTTQETGGGFGPGPGTGGQTQQGTPQPTGGGGSPGAGNEGLIPSGTQQPTGGGFGPGPAAGGLTPQATPQPTGFGGGTGTGQPGPNVTPQKSGNGF